MLEIHVGFVKDEKKTHQYLSIQGYLNSLSLFDFQLKLSLVCGVEDRKL